MPSRHESLQFDQILDFAWPSTCFILKLSRRKGEKLVHDFDITYCANSTFCRSSSSCTKCKRRRFSSKRVAGSACSSWPAPTGSKVGGGVPSSSSFSRASLSAFVSFIAALADCAIGSFCVNFCQWSQWRLCLSASLQSLEKYPHIRQLSWFCSHTALSWTALSSTINLISPCKKFMDVKAFIVWCCVNVEAGRHFNINNNFSMYIEELVVSWCKNDVAIKQLHKVWTMVLYEILKWALIGLELTKLWPCIHLGSSFKWIVYLSHEQKYTRFEKLF